MNPTPDRPTTLAQALAALREDLAAQPPAPASVLIAAQRAARQARRAATPGLSSTDADADADAAASPAGARARRLPALTGWARAGGRQATGLWGPWAGAVTCAAVLGVSLLLALRPPQVPPVPLAPLAPETAAVSGAAAASPGRVAGGQAELIPAMHFVPLVSPERMRVLNASRGAANSGAAGATGADTPAWVVTTELPQQRLAAMGLPYDPAHAAETLRAELLIAGSGEVLAVRLLF